MPSNTLKRKARRNITTSKLRTSTIKRLAGKPVIKKVDVESIKAEFEAAAKKSTPAKKAAPKKKKEEETPVAEAKAPKAPAKKAKKEDTSAE